MTSRTSGVDHPRGQRIVITPPGRWRLPPVRELWEAREVLTRFGARDVTLRYRQTGLGVAWVILQPLLGAGVFAIVFGGVAGLPSDGVPYFVMSFAGMLAWTAFNGVVGRASGSLVANQALVSKVYFPRILVPLSSVYSVLVDFVVGLAFFGVLMVVYGITPGWPLLLLPVWLLLLLMMASGIGLVASALMVKYRDVAYVLPVILQTLLYASPVAYTLAAVPEKWQVWFNLNPLTWILQEFRWSLLGNDAPDLWQIVASVVAAVVIFVGGALIFEQWERGFADVI
ncbi:ABC transporter permease [Mumia sp. DW29H23]|uniref:ABC transporter permease n=1 Tax=Mumia sp. DW29H23 TaxID=3421241 RepID=UPI003D6860DF